MGAFVNRVGQKYGALTVIRRVKNAVKTGRICWLCLCECGTKVVVQSCNIDKAISCGCYRKKKGKDHFMHKGSVGHIPISIFNSMKALALIRPHPWRVSINYLSNLLEKQNFKCALSGMDIFVGAGARDLSTTASLDRIDSSKGYIKGNVWWVHKYINWVKLDASVDELYMYCKSIIENRQKTLRLLRYVKKTSTSSRK